MSGVSDLYFDEADANLFLVDDLRLRADALRNSVLPRLHALLNEAIASVQEVYGLEALDDSTVSCYPNFRRRRTQELLHRYEAAYVGLGGRRTKGRWHGFERRDGREVQIPPFRLGFQLTADGMNLYLENFWLKGLTDESYRKLLRFHLEHESVIHSLCYFFRMTPALINDPSMPPIAPLSDQYRFMSENSWFANDFGSISEEEYPVSSEVLMEMVRGFTGFYAIYDSYIQLAKGESPRFDVLIDQLNEYLQQAGQEDDAVLPHPTPGRALHVDADQAREVAQQRTRVMPALRWQVFQRDAWRCVACGRDAHHAAILQIDHIVPRSLGGGDSMDNLQTLCHLCNAGKSNRDSTDLRNRL